MAQKYYSEDPKLQTLFQNLEISYSRAEKQLDALSAQPEKFRNNPELYKKMKDSLLGRWEKIHELLSISREVTGAERQELIEQIQQHCTVYYRIEALLKKNRPAKAAPALVKMGAFSHSLQPDFFAVESRYKLFS